MNDCTPIRDQFVTDEGEWLPDWTQPPSPFDWQVMIWGGENPRTGFEQPPLEFWFFGKHYTRKRIEQRARDLAEREHRTHWMIREPSDARFVGKEAA